MYNIMDMKYALWYVYLDGNLLLLLLLYTYI